MKYFGSLEKDKLSDSELTRIYQGIREIKQKTKKAKDKIPIVVAVIFASVIIGVFSTLWAMFILLICIFYLYSLLNIKCPRCNGYFYELSFSDIPENKLYFFKENTYCKNCKLNLNELSKDK